MKKIAVLFLFTIQCVGSFAQLIFPVASEMSIEKSNIAEPYINTPQEIIKANDSMYYAFLAGGICPTLSIRAYKNGTLIPKKYEYGDRVSDLIIKQRNNLWLAIFKLQYTDDIVAAEEIFLREKDNNIISTESPTGVFDSDNVIFYSDFTFINDSVVLCIPSFKKRNGDQILDFNSHLYYTNLDGIILDSISNPLPTINKIEKIENGFIVADNNNIYKLNESFELLKTLPIGKTVKINTQENTFSILTKENTLILFDIEDFSKKAQIQNITDLYQEKKNIYYLKNNTISYIDLIDYKENVTIELSEDKTIELEQFALKNSHLLLGGRDANKFNVSEFRAYNLQNKNTELRDVSITAKMDSFIVDTFQIHIVGNDTVIEYNNKAYFSYEVTNNSTSEVLDGIVFSPVFGGRNCSLGYIKKPFGKILPGQSIKGNGSIPIRSALSYDLCLYIPSVDNMPDQKPENNKTCIILSATDQIVSINKSVLIKPNPAIDKIEIVSDASIKMPISIYDVNGKCALKAIDKFIDISALNAGIYIAKIETKDGLVISQKFVKY
jgi:hypothetical protein